LPSSRAASRSSPAPPDASRGHHKPPRIEQRDRGTSCRPPLSLRGSLNRTGFGRAAKGGPAQVEFEHEWISGTEQVDTLRRDRAAGTLSSLNGVRSDRSFTRRFRGGLPVEAPPSPSQRSVSAVAGSSSESSLRCVLSNQSLCTAPGELASANAGKPSAGGPWASFRYDSYAASASKSWRRLSGKNRPRNPWQSRRSSPRRQRLGGAGFYAGWAGSGCRMARAFVSALLRCG
jgi:hypothetical protein